nr:putative ribonuclease H-like domain-containing protein [Tanacetum cinerariifolium]
MAFLSAVASRFPPSNTQHRTSFNPRNQATIQNGRFTVLHVQERQTQSFAGIGNRGIATTSRGNYAASQEKTEDLDTYDLDYDDMSLAKAILMVNLSTCNSDVLSKESQDVGIQVTNYSEPNDLLVVSLIEQMTDHVANLDKENQKDKMVNESLTAELERYKERVASFEQRQNSQENNMIIRKLKDKIKFLNGKDSVENVKTYIDENEMINIELEHSVEKLLYENVNLRKEQFKNKLRKLKGKNIVDTAVSKPNATIALRMFKLDIEPISQRLKNNRDAHETLRAYYEEVKISHQTSVARTPQQNGVVKRRNRTLVEAARTMLIFSKSLLFLMVVNAACIQLGHERIDADVNEVAEEMVEVIEIAKIIVDDISTAGGVLNAANEKPINVAPTKITTAQPSEATKITVDITTAPKAKGIVFHDNEESTIRTASSKSQTLRAYYEEVKISHQTSVARTPQQNGYNVFIKLLLLVIIMKKTLSVRAVSIKSYSCQFKLMLLEEEEVITAGGLNVVDTRNDERIDADVNEVAEEMVEVIEIAKIIVDDISTAGGVLNAANEKPINVAPTKITTAQPSEATKITVDITTAPKAKGIVFHDNEESTIRTASSKSQVKDKGKAKLV